MSSTKKITQLTSGQEARLAGVYQEWLEAGRGCAPLDPNNEVTAICGEFYKRIGKPAPTVLFFSSPMMCVLAWGVLRAGRSQLDSQLRSQLDSQLGSPSRSWPRYFAGQHWCAWEVFYAFCGEIGVRYTADEQAVLNLWLKQSRGLHWWFPFDGIVLASERHTAVHVDDRGRLHSPDAMACSYGDGWGIYAWHGVNIPEVYYTSEVQPAAILDERNAEVRRALIERYDEQHEKGQFLLDCGAKVLDAAVQPMRPGLADSINELLSLELPGDPDGRMLAVRCIDPSTGRQYVLRVHPELRPLLKDQKFGEPQELTVRNALASTFGLRGAQYRLIEES